MAAELRMNAANRRFVVVSGLPGSGKTTVARVLAPLLNLPVFDKDEMLERLFEARGIGDAMWRRQLSRETDDILQSSVSASSGAVISSFWHLPGMPADSGTPTEWLGGLSQAVVNVQCDCPADIAADRFLRRKRHAGHLDETRTAAEVLASIQALGSRGPLVVGEPVVVDTRNVVIGSELLHRVEAAFVRCLTRVVDERR